MCCDCRIIFFLSAHGDRVVEMSRSAPMFGTRRFAVGVLIDEAVEFTMISFYCTFLILFTLQPW